MYIHNTKLSLCFCKKKEWNKISEMYLKLFGLALIRSSIWPSELKSLTTIHRHVITYYCRLLKKFLCYRVIFMLCMMLCPCKVLLLLLSCSYGVSTVFISSVGNSVLIGNTLRWFMDFFILIQLDVVVFCLSLIYPVQTTYFLIYKY